MPGLEAGNSFLQKFGRVRIEVLPGFLLHESGNDFELAFGILEVRLHPILEERLDEMAGTGFGFVEGAPVAKLVAGLDRLEAREKLEAAARRTLADLEERNDLVEGDGGGLTEKQTIDLSGRTWQTEQVGQGSEVGDELELSFRERGRCVRIGRFDDGFGPGG